MASRRELTGDRTTLIAVNFEFAGDTCADGRTCGNAHSHGGLDAGISRLRVSGFAGEAADVAPRARRGGVGWVGASRLATGSFDLYNYEMVGNATGNRDILCL